MKRLADLGTRANPDQRSLLPFITSSLLKCVFVDLLAFYFGYNKNVDLFEHWYWGYFAQNSSAYLRREEVNEIQFVGFMLRMLWIEKLSQVAPPTPIRFGLQSFDKLSRDWRPILNDFLTWMWDDKDIAAWNDQLISHVESLFRQVHSLMQSETIEDICARIDREASQLRKKLEKGEVCRYSHVDETSQFKFTEKLFYAYLSLLKDHFGTGEILLTRSRDSKPMVKPTSAKALFDPIGGIFTHDARTRRERFRYRAGLTMSLWDMAQKEKKEPVLRRLKRPLASGEDSNAQ